MYQTLVYFQNDYEMVDYFNELREGVIEAYTGIVQGLKGEDPASSQLESLRLVTPYSHKPSVSAQAL